MPELSPLNLAQSYGFAKAYAIPASEVRDVPEGIAVLLLLLYPYDSWGELHESTVRISTYYYAAQAAYTKAKELAMALKNTGASARLYNEVRLKPLLSRLDDFAQGKNTLHYHKDYGSRFHIQIIGLSTDHFAYDKMKPEVLPPSMCGQCKKCLDACPVEALTPEGFDRSRCLRQHMMSGKPIPVHLRSAMGNRLLGCDVCQQVCPYNLVIPNMESTEEGFSLNSLLNQEADVLKRLAEQIGRNMVLPNRICAQACIVAGNSKERSYLPVLQRLCSHPSQVVAEHASWAMEKLSIEAGSATT